MRETFARTAWCRGGSGWGERGGETEEASEKGAHAMTPHALASVGVNRSGRRATAESKEGKDSVGGEGRGGEAGTCAALSIPAGAGSLSTTPPSIPDGAITHSVPITHSTACASAVKA
eukprot:2469545-Rhodomonas_salina.2